MCDGEPRVGLSLDGRHIADVALGIDLEVPLKGPFALVSTTPASFRESWSPVWGDRAEVDESYNGATYELRSADGRAVAVEMRLYNQGFAVRYRLKEIGAWKLIGERTRFEFPENSAAWAIVGCEATYPQEPLPIGKIGRRDDERVMMPLTVRVPGAGLVSLAEAYVRRCARAKLRGTGSGVAISFLDEGPAAEGEGEFETPWRVVMMARDAKELLGQGDLVLNLNPPCALADTSWIRPGLSVSDADNCPEVGPNDTFVCSFTTDKLKRIGETFADAGFRYLQLDWGWYGTECRWSEADCETFRKHHPDLADRTDWVENAKADMMTVAKGHVPYLPKWGLALDVNLDLPELVRHLKAKDMGVCVYLRGAELEKADLEKLFARYEEWGLVGIKPGFVSYGDARSTEWLRTLVETAARHRLWVDIHDREVPDGKSRTYPNLWLTEGGGGAEGCHPVRQEVIQPFARCLAGAFDFTPVFYKSNRSNAHMAAMLLVYPGPSAVVRSATEKFVQDGPGCAGAECAFVKALPMTYDETVPLEAEIGDHVTLARRKGDRWYVAGLCGERARTAKLDFGFLDSGTWRVMLLKDGVRTSDGWIPAEREDLCVTPSDRLDIAEAACGGFALIAERQAERLSPMHAGDVNYRPMRVFDDAAWIWPEQPGTNRFFRFRNDFVSDGSPLTLHVSADERYVLQLDGREISRGPARGMPSHWFCQKVSTPVAPGRHRLEAVVWALGKDAPTAQLSQGGGFFLKGEGAADALLTTGKGSWKAAPLRGTATDGRTYPRSFGCGTQFKVVGCSVLDEEPADAQWQSARVVVPSVKAAELGWGRMTSALAVFESGLPEMMMRPVKPGEIPAGKLEVAAHARREWLLDLGDYYCAYPFLTVSGGKGAKIRLGFAECLVGKDGKKLHRDARDGAFTQAYFDTFLPDGRARAVFTVPWWRCGKWCKLEVETDGEPLTIEDITLKETRYPIAIDGSFSAAGDASLADIVRICERGVEMCAHEIMFDCPFYEQQMYPGDILMSFAALRTMTRDLRLPLQGLALFDAARMPSGLVPMNWPCSHDQRGTTWTLSWVACIGEIALWGGRENLAWLKDRLPGVTHTLMSYERIENEAGLLIDPPGWNFLDWTKGWEKGSYVPPNGVAGGGPSSCINLLYLQAMERTVDLATAVGNMEMADFWRKRAARLAAGIRATFWDEARGMIADKPAKTSFSEHAVALSITTECLPKTMRDRSFSALETASDLSRASYMLHMVFSAYFRYGRGDLFLKKLDQWRDYLKLGLRCPLESPEFPRSDCHAFASTPLCHFHTGLAGVRPMGPLFEKVRVAPAPGGLKSVSVKTPHPRGTIEVDLAFDGNGGVIGTIVLPSGVDGVFEWNGAETSLISGGNRINRRE